LHCVKIVLETFAVFDRELNVVAYQGVKIDLVEKNNLKVLFHNEKKIGYVYIAKQKQ